MIGVIAAFRHELRPLLSQGDWQAEKRGWRQFYCRQLAGVKLVATSSGLGKVMAAAATQLLISTYQPRLIINVGSCGGLTPDLEIGAMVLAAKVVEYDFASLAVDKPRLDCDPELVTYLGQKLPDLRVGLLVSADRNADTPAERAWLRQTYGALIADWEGAAVVRVATKNQVPVLVLRGVTDVGATDLETEFTANVVPVMDKLAEVLLKVLTVLATESIKN